MTLVFPLVKSTDDNIELRYALRSMQYLNPTRIIIIGYKPKWLKNVEHYNFPNTPGIWWKEKNIFNKLKFAFDFTDEFLFCNDDHFLNPGFDPFVNYYSGTIGDTLKQASNGYKKTIQNTIDLIGLNALNFDCHCPIYMRKEYFEKSFKDVTFAKHGYLLKSIYAKGLEGTNYPDMKIFGVFDPAELKRRLYFSVSDRGLTNYFKATLQNLYPLKSKYE